MRSWTNHRGQVYVHLPDHPYSRKDGMYARSKMVEEEKLGRLLEPQERVLHIDGDPGNDEPENLKSFPNQTELLRYRQALMDAKQTNPYPQPVLPTKTITAAMRLHKARAVMDGHADSIDNEEFWNEMMEALHD